MAVDYGALPLPYADEDTLNISQVILGQQIYEGGLDPPHPNTCMFNPLTPYSTVTPRRVGGGEKNNPVSLRTTETARE